MSKTIPTIRFKEFDETWLNKFYGDIYSFYATNSYSREKLNYEKGVVKNIHYGDIHTKFAALFDIRKENVPFLNLDVDIKKIKKESYCQEKDLVIADASEDYADIGKTIELVNLNNEKIIAGLHTFLARPNKHEMAKGFAGYLVQSQGFRKQVMVIAQGTKVLSLSSGRLANLKVNIPDLPEQQKIAFFLSAVDEKIQQLTRKKYLLEQYKNGVMQQLFSGKLRFKDENGKAYPRWEEKRLGEVGKIRMCKRIFSNQTSEVGDIPFYKIGTFGKTADAYIPLNLFAEFKQKYPYPKVGEILMSASGTLGRTVIYDGSDAYFQDSNIVWIENNEELVTNAFLFYVYQVVRYESEGGTIQRLYNDIINRASFLRPSLPEQHKVANFLSAIDTKIDNVATQITLTQTFKKGLLQQMFV